MSFPGRNIAVFIVPAFALATGLAPALAAQGIGDLDVTIRVIERQNPDVDAFINRIELPARPSPEIADRPHRGNRDRDRERRRDAMDGRPGSGHDRDALREHGDRRREYAEERRQQATDSAELARERGREMREEFRSRERDSRPD